MNWRNDISGSDRFFSCLPYLIPIIDVVSYGGNLIGTFPIFRSIYNFIQPIMQIYNGSSMGSLAIFFLIFFLVVRNPRIHRFVRFNALQAIMLGILVSLFGLALNFVVKPLLSFSNPIVILLPMLAFLAVWAVCLFAICKSALGQYAEVPKLSENVHLTLDGM
jgi:Chloroplast import apparatus Tic20-like